VEFAGNSFSIVLMRPEIPHNTGAIGRVAVGLGVPLHLVRPLGFRLDSESVRRAGLDYWEHLDLSVHDTWDRYLESAKPGRVFFLSTHGEKSLYDCRFRPGDALVFGNESSGLPKDFYDRYEDRLFRIPMPGAHARSINLANAVSIAAYECHRQLSAQTLDFAGVRRELARGSRVLLMVRHAERRKMDNNDPTFGETLPITATGEETARAFGRLLAGVSDDVQFLASPLLRTRMTARCIAEGMGLDPACVADAAPLGNDTPIFADQRAVFEWFRDGRFFDHAFEYFATGRGPGLVELHAGALDLERWALSAFTGRLGIFASHDFQIAAWLQGMGAMDGFTRETWLRFLDGGAIVLGADGSVRRALFRAGLSEGVCGV